MTCDDSDALMRDVVARVECVASESHPRHSVVDLRYLLSGSVMILVYPQAWPWYVKFCKFGRRILVWGGQSR